MKSLFKIREKRFYPNKGNLARLASMGNSYVIEFYFVGSYPKYRKGPRLPAKQSERISLINESPWKSRNSSSSNPNADPLPVSDVAEMLLIHGIKKRKTGKRGRPGRKVWKVFDIARRTYGNRWRNYVRVTIANMIKRGKLSNIYEGYEQLKKKAIKDIQQVMLTIREPELSPKTVQYKKNLFHPLGFSASKPLVETLRMIKSLRARVVKGKFGSTSGGRPRNNPPEPMYSVRNSRGEVMYQIPESVWRRKFPSLSW